MNEQAGLDCHPSTLPVILLLNATSLVKDRATELLATELYSFDVHAAVTVETWFSSKHLDDEFALGGFTMYRSDKLRRRGGGVCICVRDNIIANTIDVPSMSILM